MVMDEITLAVSNLEELTKRIKEVYRHDLEYEIKNSVDELLFINKLDHYRDNPIITYFFTIGYNKHAAILPSQAVPIGMPVYSDIGFIFPFIRKAFLDDSHKFIPKQEEIFDNLKMILNKRGYLVSSTLDSRYKIIENIKQEYCK